MDDLASCNGIRIQHGTTTRIPPIAQRRDKDHKNVCNTFMNYICLAFSDYGWRFRQLATDLVVAIVTKGKYFDKSINFVNF